MALARRAVIAFYVVLFWLLLPGLLVWGAMLFDAALGRRLAASPWGVVLFVGGALFIAWAIAFLWRRGRGLPISALPPPALVTDGPYGMVRHPIYLGFNTMVLGAAWWAGSFAGVAVITPLFFVAWVAYALIEERFLRRRFGRAYRRYCDAVGLLPRFPMYRFGRLLTRLLPVRVEGAAIPKSGGAVIIATHACYLDPFVLGRVTRRRIHFAATAQLFRSRFLAAILRRAGAFPLKRYARDGDAAREMVRLVGEGKLVGLFPEGERSVRGVLQPVLPAAAHLLKRLNVPVIPVGINGNYNVGPRWSDALRRRPVVLRVGEPIVWRGERPEEDVDGALKALLSVDPQPLDLTGLAREKLARVLWRCPRCLEEAPWRAAELRCHGCSATWRETSSGFFKAPDGEEESLADLCAPLWRFVEEGELTAKAEVKVERDLTAPLRPLAPLGTFSVRFARDGILFSEAFISYDEVRSAPTEAAEILQVATGDALYQFRLAEVSVFRARRIVLRRAGLLTQK